jgi:acyl-CoA thioester hydrolase
MQGFAFVHREIVRFRDADGFGHVNNAVYLTYVEQARIAYLVDRGVFARPTQDEMSMILARAEIDFRAPLAVGEEVEIGVRTARVGNKSFALEYELHADSRVVAAAATVLVAFDYARDAPVTIPDEWRRRLNP